jgi:hypothetical protein
VGDFTGPRLVLPMTASTLLETAEIGCGPLGTSSMYTPGDK